MSEMVIDSFTRLKDYCNKEKFCGWDPYDGLNSKLFEALPLISKKQLTKLMWIQLVKKMPLNLRRFFKVEKGYNAKGLALFISAYAKLSEIENFNAEAIDKINELSAKVISLKAAGYSGSCWGYNFDWQSRAFFLKKGTPTIVATSFVANALIDAYEATKNELFLREAISSKDFIIRDLNRTYNDKGNFAFSYSPLDRTSVFNASLLGARLLSRIYKYHPDEVLINLSRKAIAFCCENQNNDGSWYYSTLPFHKWIDNFHTGFNLECIFQYEQYSNDSSFRDHFNRGMTYYLENFFDSEGKSKYYNDSLYPIDIHAPSQLIVTLSKTNLFEKNKETAERVIEWTIKNMQSRQGYFFFQKRKYYTNKIPYMRWSQAWMFYGLAHYLKEGEGLKTVLS